MRDNIYNLCQVFSPVLYPFFRDENGLPRTPRDVFGFPENFDIDSG